MKGKYKRVKGWCDSCDAEIVEGIIDYLEKEL